MPAERNGAVAGVVLAAGSSTRMGRNKLFFELDGETLLRRVVRRAIGAGLDPVIVVVGHEGERAGTELSGLSCVTVVNPDHAEGINRSLQTGISHVPERARAAVVMLADMPFVTSSMVAGARHALPREHGPTRHLRLRGRQRAADAVRPRIVP